MRILIIMILLSSCTTVDKFRCFTIDGKAYGSCMRGRLFERMCQDHGGLKEYGGLTGTCNNGKEVAKYPEHLKK